MRKELTPLEKASLLSGDNVWQTRSVPRAGIRSLFLSDGPHGIRRQAGDADHLGLHASLPSTCFPTAATIANSWDPELGEQIGRAIGIEARSLGVDVVLGPGLNIKRSPLCGRNFEYFSEDPHLTGQLAAAYVRGIQSTGVAACPKHFAVNSQETERMTSDSRVDERTLREIYLSAFETVVRESFPLSIMSSYNRINGVYAHENRHLLTEVLREAWGFDGAVISDWGGSCDAVEAVRAGGTLEMPSPGWDSVQQILTALDSGQLSVEDLDARVTEIVQLADRLPARENTEDFDVDAHHCLARRAAAESVVLLKNEEQLLPLAAGTRVALIGDFAEVPRYQGAGSSMVNPTRLSTGREAAQASALEVLGYAQGFARSGEANAGLAEEARLLAQRSDVVLLWLGLDELSESEGLDRRHMSLPQNQLDLLEQLSQTGTPVIVVLSGGSAVEVEWLELPSAAVHAYLGGQAGAEAVLQVLTGVVNPSGRLAETYPRQLAETPTGGRFPAQGGEVDYVEGLLVGYRYYATAGVPTALPFGHGLSYTSFEYADLRVDEQGAEFTLTNTGARSGAEVAQLYLSRDSPSGVLRPVMELAGFAKVSLAAGESRQVRLPLGERSFRHFDPHSGSFQRESGAWRVMVGASVEDVRLQARIQRDGTLGAPQEDSASEQARALVARIHEARRQGARSTEQSPKPGETVVRRTLGMNDPLAALTAAHSPLARAAGATLTWLLARSEARGEPNLNLMFLAAMPLRAAAKMSGGTLSLDMTRQVLTLVNGRHLAGLGGLAAATVRHRRVTRRLAREHQRLSASPAVAVPGAAPAPAMNRRKEKH